MIGIICHLGHPFGGSVSDSAGSTFAVCCHTTTSLASGIVIAIEVPGAVVGPVLVKRQILVEYVADTHGRAALDLAGDWFGHKPVAAFTKDVVRE